ncbi:hypothetical protein [Nannocystis bainbridge]|uniref:Uncharacterized protein n=1 Tax=Nannocystis bainbridge TaxID=2995303 RepID=A0ABT5DW08_9BACT|nr:hypothetical protein [Nannocystis bainbridge]MDC0717771.1 hypothetical protein [Nannocystis bainbridge]
MAQTTVPTRVQEMFARMRVHQQARYGDESLPAMETVFGAEVERFPSASVLAAAFTVFQGSLAEGVIVQLPALMRRLTYRDLVDAFIEMSHDDLAIYHYSWFLPKLFGIDPPAMVERHPELREALGHNLRHVVRVTARPNEWSQEYLADRGTSQPELLARMQQQGAPMVER